MTEVSIEPFAQAHLDGLIALVTAQGWTEYTDDVERTYRALRVAEHAHLPYPDGCLVAQHRLPV